MLDPEMFNHQRHINMVCSSCLFEVVFVIEFNFWGDGWGDLGEIKCRSNFLFIHGIWALRGGGWG
jgi:hypothetical protein